MNWKPVRASSAKTTTMSSSRWSDNFFKGDFPMSETYKGFRPDEMEYQYNPRESVPEYPEPAKVRAAQAKKVRETAKSWLNFPYTESPRELLDISAAATPGVPLFFYIHFGTRRSARQEDKREHSATLPKHGAS